MKKSGIFVVAALLALNFWIFGCGGGGGENTVVAAPAPVPTPTPTPTLVRQSIKVDGFKTIPESQYTESIVIAINAGFASGHADWKDRAQDMINYANIALNRNVGNKKQYTIGRFMTYPDANIVSMFTSGSDSSFYLDNGFTYCAGTTFFVYIGTSKPSFFTTIASDFANSRMTAEGRTKEEVWLYYSPLSSFVSPFSAPITLAQAESDGNLNLWLHELAGHGNGLAYEEWYRYSFADTSGVLPNLGQYVRGLQFPLDPMCAGGVGVQFAPFNSWLINKNANHQYNCTEIVLGIPALIKIKVVDNAGNPVSGASVKTFAGVLGNMGVLGNIPITTPILLLSATTASNGEVSISSDDGSVSIVGSLTFDHKFGYILPAKIIKVSAGGKNAGMFLTLTDLEMAFLQQGLDTYTVTIALP